ncbi:MAG: hypothetical protein IJ723_05885 [Ruminococcus sp.]|nr:hypothetical protein [Ruminococcus sp.]
MTNEEQFTPEQPAKKKRKGLKTIIIVVAVVVGLIILFPPLMLHTTVLQLYPACRVITNMHQNLKEPEWFGDYSGDVESVFAFDYMPSVMQGTGHYTVRFKTSPEKAKEYADRFAAQAQYEFMLSEYGDGIDVRDLGYDATESNCTLTIFYDKEFWQKNRQTTKVYVSSASLDWNHPHSSAVLIDEEAGMVELSQLG